MVFHSLLAGLPTLQVTHFLASAAFRDIGASLQNPVIHTFFYACKMNTAWVILSRSAGSSRYRVTLSPMATGPLCTVVAELGRLLPCFAAGKVLQWQSLSTFSFQVHLRFWQVGVSVRDLSWCATVKSLPLQVNAFIPVTMTAIFSAPPLSATLSYLYTSCVE